MNVDTGHLMRLQEGQKAPAGYVEIPGQLRPAAMKKLAGKNEAHVSLTSGGKLSSWAASQRKKRDNARKSKRKSARVSRRLNWGR